MQKHNSENIIPNILALRELYTTLLQHDFGIDEEWAALLHYEEKKSLIHKNSNFF